MESSTAAQYGIRLRYEQHLALFSRQNGTAAAQGNLPGQTRTAGAAVLFTLEIRGTAQVRFQGQAEVVSLAGSKTLPGPISLSQDAPPLPRTPEEAAEMIGEEGYWGIKKTAARLAEFVIRGAGDDLSRLRAGRAGIIKGFKEAEALWGSALPEISHQTLATALAAIDERIRSLDGSVVDAAA